MKTYYLHTSSLMDATDNGSASVILYSDHLVAVKELEMDIDGAQANFESAMKLVKELKDEVDRLNQKYDFQLLVKSNEQLKKDAICHVQTMKMQIDTNRRLSEEIQSLTSKLQKAREAIKRAIYLDDYGGVQSDKPMDVLRATLKEIGVES